MDLTHSQKKYLKKNLKKIPLKEIANNLKISEDELSQYLETQWGNEKYQNFISHLKKAEKPDNKTFTPNFNWKIFAFLAFLVFTIYYNSLGNDFVSDDILAIKDNPNINKISYMFKLPNFNINIRSLIISLTDTVFGLNPVFYRLPNIFFHLGSTWIIFILIGLFFKSPVPLLAAGLFAVHPIFTEGVTWISGGSYSNGAFFLLSAFLAYLSARRNNNIKIYFFSLLSFFMALLFSEKFITFPLILLFYEICFGQFKNNWRQLIPFFFSSFLFALKLLGLLGERITSLETAYYQQPGMANPLIQIPIAITSYLELIFWPKNLTLYHSEMSFSQIEYFSRLGVFVFFLGIMVWFFKKDRRIFFWLSFFLISLLPTLTPLGVSWIVAERYVYLGTIGILVPVAVLIEYIGRKLSEPKLSYVILGVLVILLGTRTILRNNDWKNQDTLWLATAKTSPSSAQNHNNLGDYYGRQGNLEKAVEEFQTAIKLQPNYGDAYHNLGNTYQQMQKYDLALANYQKALEFNPNLWQSHVNIGIIYFNSGDKQKAQEEFQKALKIDPQNTKIKEFLLQTNL